MDSGRGTHNLVCPRSGVVAPAPGVVARDYCLDPCCSLGTGRFGRTDAQSPRRSGRGRRSDVAGPVAGLIDSSTRLTVLYTGVLETIANTGVRASLSGCAGPVLGAGSLGCAGGGLFGHTTNRVAALARYGLASKAATLELLAEPRRTATLLALTRHLDASAVDDVLDLFSLLMATRVINPRKAASNADRLSWLPRLERASRTLALVNRELLAAMDEAALSGSGLNVAELWNLLEKIAPRGKIAEAVTTVTELVPDDSGAAVALRVALTNRYRV